MSRGVKIALAVLAALILLVGLLDMAANIAFVAASGRGSLSLVTIITATYPAPTVLLARLVLGERIGLLRLAGLVLAVSASAMIGLG